MPVSLSSLQQGQAQLPRRALSLLGSTLVARASPPCTVVSLVLRRCVCSLPMFPVRPAVRPTHRLVCSRTVPVQGHHVSSALPVQPITMSTRGILTRTAVPQLVCTRRCCGPLLPCRSRPCMRRSKPGQAAPSAASAPESAAVLRPPRAAGAAAAALRGRAAHHQLGSAGVSSGENRATQQDY